MYKEPKIVRSVNGQQFIYDFKRYCEILAYTSATGEFFPVKRRDVWEKAKRSKIHYYITDEIYIVKRKVIVIV